MEKVRILCKINRIGLKIFFSLLIEKAIVYSD